MSVILARWVLFTTLIGSLFLGAVGHASAADVHYTVTSPDGVTIAVQETGNPQGTPIVFVHGLLGSRLNWAGQVHSRDLQNYRLITFDLRGHGLSGHPDSPGAYGDGRRWGDDLAAVIQGTHARKPILVGWSLGGAVITQYLASHGDANVGGVVYVDAVIELNAQQIQPHPEVYRDMTSTDLQTHLDGERTFLGLCFHHQPDADVFQRLLAGAAMASWDMQRAVPGMTIPLEKGLSHLHVPMILIYGAKDALVKSEPSIARAKTVNPSIAVEMYDESGHAPFLEEPARFNRDLAAFVSTSVARMRR